MLDLYPFQKTIFDDCLKLLSENVKNIQVVAPTGSGKTVIFSHISKFSSDRNMRVLILVHRREILQQTLKKMYGLDVKCGQIASGRPMTRDLIQCAMISTLVNRLDIVKKPDIIICDENHHIMANQYIKVLKYFEGVPLIGFSATPVRLDGQGLGGIFTHMLQAPQINDLVNMGYLSYPVIYNPPIEVMKYHIRRGDYDLDEQEQVMSRKKIVGDVIDHWRKYSEYQPTLGYCVSVKHSHHMAEQFNNAGYKALAMWGGMSDKDRECGIKALSDGSVHVLFSCDLFSEGLDIPVVNTGIFLRKTKSLGLWMQQAGRILRKHPGKKNAILLDHVGNSLQSEHGHILNYREWSLDGIKKNDKNGVIPKTTNCPKCFGTWSGEPKICPSCGFQFSYNETVANQQRKAPEIIQGELKQALPNLPENEIKDLTKFISNIQVLDGQTRNKALIAKFFELQDQKRMKEISKIVGYKDSWSSVIWNKYIKNKVRKWK